MSVSAAFDETASAGVSRCDRTQQQSRADFLRTLFQFLEEMSVPCCVLPATDALAGQDETDKTCLAIPPEHSKSLPAVLQRLRDRGYWPVRRVRGSADRHSLMFMWLNRVAVGTVVLELCFGQQAGGRRVFSGEVLVKDRRKEGNLWHPSAAVEFSWLMAETAAAATASVGDAGRLRARSRELGREEADRIAKGLFGARWGRKAVEGCLQGSIQTLLPALCRRLWITSLTRHPLQLANFWIRKGCNRVERWKRPAGMFVVLMGPDGSGKSTVAKFLAQALKPVFAIQRQYHWRAGLLGKRGPGRIVTAPHQSPPRGPIASVCHLLAFFCDNVFGFVFVIRPLLVRSGLVMFDRYFPDLLVDSKRYRYGGPVWLPRLLARFVPPSDQLILVLDGSEANIRSRKDELSSSEIRRQRDLYRRLTSPRSGMTRILDTDSGVEPTQKQALEAVAGYLAKRFQ